MSPLHLKNLTLKGFKSFAQSTTLIFEPGITAVVGPNGSGKSNVVDALAWVMGEQGAKSLRGGKMEDVIFAGTATKAPLGRASVELTIDNSDGVLAIDYSEVTIARTLFRNGVSEYSINGESCRLLDVQELLSDSGLGREMHVIVGQGQLDTVLKADPMERRGLIEEAAGILKYRRRKERSERKLEAMQSNMQRLSDLIAEVKRQLRPLGRQAEVAMQAKEIQAQLRQSKSRLYAFEISNLRAQLEATNSIEGQRRAEQNILQQQIDSNRQVTSELEGKLVSGEIDRARSVVFQLDGLSQKLRNLESLISQRKTLLGASAVAPDVDITDLGAQLAAIELQQQQSQAELAAIEDQLFQAESHRDEIKARLSDVEIGHQAAIRQAQAQLEQMNIAKNELSTLQARISSKQEQVAGNGEAITSASLRKANLESDLSATGETLVLANEAQLRDDYETASRLREKAASELDSLRSEMHVLEREQDGLGARFAALSMSLDSRDGSQQLREESQPGVLGMIADFLEIETGYQSAVAMALGSVANSLVADSLGNAVAAAKKLRTENLGWAEILVVDNQTSGKLANVTIDSLPALTNFVSGPPSILSKLQGIFLVTSSNEVEQGLSNSQIFALVTLEGDYYSRDTIRAGGTDTTSKLELSAERDSAGKSLDQVGKDISKKQVAIDRAEQELAEATVRDAAALDKLRQVDAELARQAEKSGKLRAQIEATEQEISRLQQLTETAVAEIATLQANLGELSSVVVEPPEVLAPAEIGRLNHDLEVARSVELEIRVNRGAATERSSQLGRTKEQIQQQIQAASSAQLEFQQQQQLRQQQLAKAERVSQLLPVVSNFIRTVSDKARLQLGSLEQERDQYTERLGKLRAEVADLMSKLSVAKDVVHAIELRNHEFSLHLNNLISKVSEELQLTESDVLAEFFDEKLDVDQTRAELSRSEAAISKLGQFNPLALEEFSALEERYKYLTEQQSDVDQARADLRGIIGTLDEQMQDIFAEAFADTQKAFSEIFPLLFPGGSGAMNLTDPENLLTTGIDISVRPAGKKIDRLSLLSGGERSLAAVTVLLSIFKARPSPFYVLDEVEAALDDANLGRLIEVISSLRESSQLIIITHQKRTMEIADALYGVSMKQDGITKVIGTKMEKQVG